MSGGQTLWRSAGAAIILVLSGCYSDFPLDSIPQVNLDAKLLGTWRCLPPDPEADSEAATFAFTRTGDRVYGVRSDEKGKEPDLFEAHLSLVKKRLILNVRLLEAGLGKPWAFVRYSFLLPNVLRLQYVDGDAFSPTCDSEREWCPSRRGEFWRWASVRG